MGAGDVPAAYGGFTLGAMRLALPMAALREVLPCSALQPLPCPSSCVVGGLSLRGVLLPVVDLRLLLGQTGAACPVVVVMVHGGRLLGLLADEVNGIFNTQGRAVQAMSAGAARTAASAAVLAGSALRADTGELVSVLSPAALAAWPQLPWLDDPEPRRQAQAQGDADAGEAAQAKALVPVLPMMLVRCGRIGVALDAMAVHATLSELTIEPSVLSQGGAALAGGCLGVIDYAGSKVPVLDLQALCGFGPLSANEPPQAFVLRLDSGMVALLISAVLDVAATRPGDVLPVPVLALPRQGLFTGALPATGLAPEVAAEARALAPQYLVIDAAALKALPEVQSLAQTNTPGHSSAQVGTPGLAVGASGEGLRPMITYDLGGETATPIEQVAEILPFQPETVMYATGTLLGMVVNRGRSIPVLCLSGLSGLPRPALSPAVSVLVVESNGEAVGFAVPRLRAIEPARWEPDREAAQARGSATVAAVVGQRQLALVGHAGHGERMLRVLDLQRLASALQQQAMTA